MFKINNSFNIIKYNIIKCAKTAFVILAKIVFVMVAKNFHVAMVIVAHVPKNVVDVHFVQPVAYVQALFYLL